MLRNLLHIPPRRQIGPTLKGLFSPCSAPIRVTGSARIGNFILLGYCGRNETKCVAADEIIRKGLLDPGHVAGKAIVPRATGLMMRMGLDALSVVRAVG